MRSVLSTIFAFLLMVGSGQYALAQESGSEANPFKFVKVDHTQTDWYLEMQSDNPNVLAAEELFNSYFQENFKESSKQKKMFVRWLQTAKLSMDENGFHIPYEANPAEVPQAMASSSTGSWRMTGPNFAQRTTCGTNSSLSGGFCDRVYINPQNTDNLYAGFSYGGLWVSQDQGQTWELTDAEFSNGTNTYANRDYYYGEIEASGVIPTTVFAATEAGLLKSSNAGAEWEMCPELNRVASPGLRPYYVALSTTDASRVLATFGRKLYLSVDGGNNWQVAFDNQNGGNNHHFTSQYSNNSTFGIYERNYNFFGLEPDHDDPSTFYLGVWNSSNQPCIYRSTDNGVSFSLLANLNTVLNRTLPGNLVFQTIPAQPDRFYVYPQFEGGDTLYRFDQTGGLISKNLIGTNYIEGGDINWLDENSVYAGFYFASSVMKSTDGAVSFTDQTSGYAGCPKYVHPDIRGIDVVGDVVLIGSDGGVAISTDAMNTVSSDIGREISSVDLWGYSSSPKSDIIAAGCDHGPTKIRRFDADNGWISRGGGDAGMVSVNQSHDRWIYYDHGYGKFKTYLNTNNAFEGTVGINPGVSLHRVEFHPNLYQTAYGITGTQVRVSRDNFSSFNLFYDFGQTMNVFKLAQQDTLKMYVLLANNTIKKSIDGGANWSVITPPTSVSAGQTNIVDITLGDDPLEIWAAYGNWQNTGKVLRSTDGGNTWVNVSSPNLPTTPITEIVYQRGSIGGAYIAFAGKSGVWYKNASMSQWEPLGSGLASIGYVQHIYVVPAKGKFRMGSSRGSWEHDLYEESTAPVASFAANINISSCPSIPVEFVQNCSHSSGPAIYNWTFTGGYPSTSTDENPMVSYYTPGQYDVSLEVVDEFGNSHTRTLPGFITVQSNCGDSDMDGLDDLAESTNCDHLLSALGPIVGTTDSILVTDFDGNVAGQYYVNLNIETSCNSASATLQASINLDSQAINVTSYQHFGSSAFNDPVVGSGTAIVSSQSATITQCQLKLIGNALYLFQTSSTCSNQETMQLPSSCWSSIDTDGDGILNYLDNDSDNDGILDMIENTTCYNTIGASANISGSTTAIITDFGGATSGIYFIELDVLTDCNAEVATVKAFVDLNDQQIDVFGYRHFGSSTFQDQMNGSGSSTVESTPSSTAQFRLSLANSTLSLQQLSSTCSGTIHLQSSCYSSLDEDGDGILNYLDLDSDDDGLSDSLETVFCDQSVGSSSWFSAGDSVLVADLSTVASTVNVFYMNLNAFTNCYNLNANMKVFVDVDEQKIDVLSYQHFSSSNTNDPVLGSGTNTVTAQASSFATIRYKLTGTLVYLHQVSNACGSVLRLNGSCWNKFDVCATNVPDYLNATHVTTNASVCRGDSYTFPDGSIEHDIMAPISHTSQMQTITNCDSTVVTHIDIVEIDTSVTQNGEVFGANAVGATYQWIDCQNNNAVMAGENEQHFTATENGSYAVIVEQQGCIDTSSCHQIMNVGLIENTFGSDIILYPNPSDGMVFISLSDFYAAIELEITALNGSSVLKQRFSNSKSVQVDISGLASAKYLLRITTSGKRAVFGLIKN